MQPPADRVALIINRLAAAVAVLVAISLPLGYALIAFNNFSDTLAFEAKVKANALTGLVANDPDAWMFTEARISALIAQELMAFDDERVQVFTAQGTLVTQNGSAPRTPALSQRARLKHGARSVGHIEVSSSLLGVIYETAAVAVLGLLLGSLVFIVMRVVPLRALRRVTDALFDEKERAETTLHSITDAVITTDWRGKIEYLNPTAEQLLGTTYAEARGQDLSAVVFLINGTTRERIDHSLYWALSEGCVVSCQGSSELCRPDSTTIAVEERSAPIFDHSGRVTGGVTVLRDVSVSREYTQRRSWEATHDLLTGLVNRREFQNRVAFSLDDLRGDEGSHVVCYMDLDRFKVINDSCGHAAGDQLLIQIAGLMQTRIRDTDTLARLGGDEFGLLLERCDLQRGQVIANEIMTAVQDFIFTWEDKLFTVGVSIGMTAISRDHRSVGEVLSEADCACYWAKEQGRNRVCVYRASDMDLAARRSQTGWVARINAALEEQRFVLYHQAYRALDPTAGEREHLEILLRMIDENGDLVAPGCFLPAAERYNLMPPIDRWVVRAVFSAYGQLVAERGDVPVTCSINLSGASINSEGFIEYVRAQMHEFQLPPAAICFELTETVAVNNLEAAAEFMSECQAMGIRFALDDFGTGTSSFGYLKTLPVDYLKIDGGFVKNIEHDGVDLAMTETINRIGHIMGKKTIAEYAENEAIIAMLKTMGVDFAQGYGVCLPKPLFALRGPAALPAADTARPSPTEAAPRGRLLPAAGT